MIDKIKTYCTKKDLSERDFSALKKLAIEYTALNNVQKQKGLFTKDLERVLNASLIPADIKSGDFYRRAWGGYRPAGSRRQGLGNCTFKYK